MHLTMMFVLLVPWCWNMQQVTIGVSTLTNISKPPPCFVVDFCVFCAYKTFQDHNLVTMAVDGPYASNNQPIEVIRGSNKNHFSPLLTDRRGPGICDGSGHPNGHQSMCIRYVILNINLNQARSCYLMINIDIYWGSIIRQGLLLLQQSSSTSKFD